MRHTRIIVTRYGGPDALRVVEEECPEPKHGEVRVRVLAAGVSLPDLLMREGVHPETPGLPFTPGWDLVGVVDGLGAGISGLEPGQMVAALPITGAYAEFVCLPQRELVPVPSGLDAAEAVSLVLNYVTAYQMLHRSAKVRSGQRVLIHGAAGGVGSALLQLGCLAGLEMYGTCSSRGAPAVSDLGGLPIDYQHQDFVKEIHRLTNQGVDVVFDGIGGTHIWRSRKALRPGGRVVAYGLTSSLSGGRLASGRSGRRQRFRGIRIFGLYIAGGWLLPGRKRVVPYSIQWLKRLNPALFRQDLIALFELGAWLFTVARNLHVSYCRSRLLEDSHMTDLIGLWPTRRGGPSPLEAAEASEAQRRIAAALAALPVTYREALLLTAVEGLRPSEAAEICGVTADAMRQRLSRARALLARLLADAQAPGLTALNEATT